MKNKFKAIKNIILGRPVMYRMRLKAVPDGSSSHLYIDGTTSIVAECTFTGVRISPAASAIHQDLTAK